MTGNAETLEEIRDRVLAGKFTGQVVLHCRNGLIEVYEVNERVQPPWKRRLDTGHLRDVA